MNLDRLTPLLRSTTRQLCLAGLALVAACSSPDASARRTVQATASPLDLSGSAYEAGLRVALPADEGHEAPGLHNLFALSESILSGSEPEGEEAFQYLAEQGVKTILSVDGKVPDQELAAEYGMRYVHVPIEYRGITDEQRLQIAKSFRELEGPFFVHCYHGVHRGPAAAALGRVVLDGAPREQALAEMRQWCGTSESYEGLYRVIAEGDLPAVETTAAYDFDFPAAHRIEGYRGGMIVAARAMQNLKYLSRNNWQPTDHHPDANGLNEATRLVEVLQRSAALDEVQARPEDHAALLDASLAEAFELRVVLKALAAGEADEAAASEQLAALKSACVDCHVVYRNQ